MTVVVGLCGTAGSGKTTVARYLERVYGATSYALATPIKHILARTHLLSEVQLYGTQHDKECVDPRYGVSPRDLMHRMGDALKAVFGDDYLVEHTLGVIRKDAHQLVVIDDVRRLAEADVLRGWGVRFIRVPKRSSHTFTHAAETEWERIDVDWELPLTATPEDLHREVDRACAALRICPVLHHIEAP